MNNPQGPGKQRKGQNKATQPHHGAGAPGRSDQHQPGQRVGEQGHTPHHPSHSTPEEE
jgi:hypothetical protein